MTVPPQASSIDDDFIPILNDLKRELVWEFEHSKTGALPMLKARDRMNAYIHSTTTTTLEELRGMLPEKRYPRTNEDNHFNIAIDQFTKAIDTLIERRKS